MFLKSDHLCSLFTLVTLHCQTLGTPRNTTRVDSGFIRAELVNLWINFGNNCVHVRFWRNAKSRLITAELVSLWLSSSIILIDIKNCQPVKLQETDSTIRVNNSRTCAHVNYCPISSSNHERPSMPELSGYRKTDATIRRFHLGFINLLGTSPLIVH